MMKLLLHDDVNFVLTNRLPRRSATRLMGRLSKIELGLIRAPSLALWRFFAAPDLSDAAETRFQSLHHAFTRALKPGARPFDPDPRSSPAPATRSSAPRGGSRRRGSTRSKAATIRSRN